jgi:Flp pilus assembly protein TadG
MSATTAADGEIQARQLLGEMRRNEDGATAVEFALIALPFLTLLIGMMSICIYFFTVLYTENAVWAAARDIRTGALQTGSGAYSAATTLALKQAKLKEIICSRTPNASTCLPNLRVIVQARTAFSSIVAPSCTSGGDLINAATESASFDPGASSSIVLMTACYSWQFGGQLPFFKLGNLNGGAYLIQASAAFRTEPYN